MGDTIRFISELFVFQSAGAPAAMVGRERQGAGGVDPGGHTALLQKVRFIFLLIDAIVQIIVTDEGWARVIPQPCSALGLAGTSRRYAFASSQGNKTVLKPAECKGLGWGPKR